MSMFRPRVPNPAASAPALPPIKAKMLETADSGSDRSRARNRRRGRSALRIDLATGRASDGSGVNVPRS